MKYDVLSHEALRLKGLFQINPIQRGFCHIFQINQRKLYTYRLVCALR